MINTNKQEQWSIDIKLRMNILLNAFLDKCTNLSEDDLQIISKVENIIKNSSINYIIDEYKCITDESVVKMFEFSNDKFCKVFRMLFSSKSYIYEFQQKQRLEFENKLELIKNKYGKNVL